MIGCLVVNLDVGIPDASWSQNTIATLDVPEAKVKILSIGGLRLNFSDHIHTREIVIFLDQNVSIQSLSVIKITVLVH